MPKMIKKTNPKMVLKKKMNSKFKLVPKPTVPFKRSFYTA